MSALMRFAMSQVFTFTEAGKAAGYTEEHLGLIPMFLLGQGDAMARLNDGYMRAAGCPFRPLGGFTLNDDYSLSYAGNTPLPAMATAVIGVETVCFYDSSWVAVIQPDRSFVVARMD